MPTSWSSRAPDYAAPLIGWRVWRVVETAAGLRLWSVLHDEEWAPGRALDARCLAGGTHVVPDPDCGCGVHAARERKTARVYRLGRDDHFTVARVLGEVALWGRVVEAEHGWRAEHAYPMRLRVDDPRLGDVLATAYRVPVVGLAEVARR